MTDNTDAKIARQWAEANTNAFTPTVPTPVVGKAIARHILNTTTPPPMSDVEWDDSTHAGLCAEHPLYGVVRMLEYDHMDRSILCLTRQLHCEWSEGYDLTPLPGTRVDLTPHREPIKAEDDTPERADIPRPRDVPAGEIWEVKVGEHIMIGVRSRDGEAHWDTMHPTEDSIGVYLRDSDITLVRRLVPEATPDHPAELTTEADYRNAPAGTVVATEGMEAWTKDLNGLWETWGVISGYTNYAMADGPRLVLRWGWKA